MNYNFDQVINRKHTASKKWDMLQEHFGTDNIIPMWVADMDFLSPAPVIEALKNRADQGVYGYTIRTDSYLTSIVDWFKRRHGWSINKEWISHSPGIISALSLITHTFTQPGDKVMVQSPVHHAFYRVLKLQGREVVENPLTFENGQYRMNFDDFEAKLDPKVKVMFLCSPHNPVGRVWSKEELTKLGEICMKHNILVVSDEVHCDLTFKSQTHIPFASISEEFSNNSITCISPSKTFNLVGLKTSGIIIPNTNIRVKFENAINAFAMAAPSYFGVVALESAYRYGEEWLNQLLDYLQGNVHYLTDFINENLPKVKVIQPEGTYLAWLDFRELDLNRQELNKMVLEEAHIGFDDGPIFGTGGEGFMRLNFAAPRSVLEQGLQQLKQALNSREGSLTGK
ncbi:MalY/PatB family protein [Virgibacillus sp. FSP13]